MAKKLGNYLGFIDKDGGKVQDLPLEAKKIIYDCIMSVDLEESDRLREEGQYYGYQFDDMPGVTLIIYEKKIVALIQLGVYDMKTESINDSIVVAMGVPRNDIEGLLDDRPKQYH